MGKQPDAGDAGASRHAHLAGIARRITTIDGRPFSGTVYRYIGSRFLTAPLGSAGSIHHGGRFNPPGAFEVLYTALTPDTALAEREGLLLTAAGITAARTGVLLRISCRLTSVLNLADEAVRQELQIPLSALLSPWLPWNVVSQESKPPSAGVAPSQRIGVGAYNSRRFEAILSLSAKDAKGRCLAIFPDHLLPESLVSIDDPGGVIAGALGLARR